jgi:hypothetical protein
MYVRWVQWGAFSGAFRSHERGMSAGGCADSNPPSCSIVEVRGTQFSSLMSRCMMSQNILSNSTATPCNGASAWCRTSTPALVWWPYALSLQVREAFELGLGLTRPMYYDYPECDGAYWTNKKYVFMLLHTNAVAASHHPVETSLSTCLARIFSSRQWSLQH